MEYNENLKWNFSVKGFFKYYNNKRNNMKSQTWNDYINKIFRIVIFKNWGMICVCKFRYYLRQNKVLVLKGFYK